MRKILTSSLFTSAIIVVLALPWLSFAQTTDVAALQAQIAALLAQIQQLQAQLAAAQGGGVTPWCHTFTANLSSGSSGEEVTALQTALTKAGFSVNIDGVFGENTAAEVTGFQEKYRSEILDPAGLNYGTGIVGARTRAKLNQLYGCGTTITPPPPVTSASSSITVLSPNGGETLQEGQTYTINWTSANIPSDAHFFIQIFRSDGASIQIASNLPASQNYFVWKVNTSAGWAVGMKSKTSIFAQLFGVNTANAADNYLYKVEVGAERGIYGQSNWFNAYDYGDNYFSINLTTTTSTTTTTQPITVISPQEGNRWFTGKTYRISWQPFSAHADTFVYLSGGGHEEGYSKYIGSPIGNAYLDYSITNTDLPIVSGASWKVLVCDGKLVNGGVNCGISGQIIILTSDIVSTTTPSITVLSPNGGEQWNIGSQQTLRWSTNIPASNVNLLLYDQSPRQINYTIAINANNNGSYNWTVPSNLLPGQYKVEVWASSNAYDLSDAPFTITATTSSTTVSLPNPNLYYVGSENYSTSDESKWTRYKLYVTNWTSYPDSLFSSAPDLPPCGLNNNSSRTWVNIYNASNNSYIYGFCGFQKASDLTSPWFAVSQGTNPPPQVYMEIVDRKTNTTYRSNNVSVYCGDCSTQTHYSEYFLNPMAGENIPSGSTYRIVWGIWPPAPQDGTRVYLELRSPEGNTTAISQAIASTGYYDWSVPVNPPQSATGKYFLRLYFSGSTYFNGTIDGPQFTISGTQNSTTTPGVGAVSSPSNLANTLDTLGAILIELQKTLVH